MTITRNKTAAFPENLLVTVDTPQSSQWNVLHNVAIYEYLNRHKDIPNKLRDVEVAILSLAEAINNWVSTNNVDGFSLPNIIQPLFEGFSDALNYDLGRLDGGTLSSWQHDTLKSHGINSDTYEWLTEVSQ